MVEGLSVGRALACSAFLGAMAAGCAPVTSSVPAGYEMPRVPARKAAALDPPVPCTPPAPRVDVPCIDAPCGVERYSVLADAARDDPSIVETAAGLVVLATLSPNRTVVFRQDGNRWRQQVAPPQAKGLAMLPDGRVAAGGQFILAPPGYAPLVPAQPISGAVAIRTGSDCAEPPRTAAEYSGRLIETSGPDRTQKVVGPGANVWRGEVDGPHMRSLSYRAVRYALQTDATPVLVAVEQHGHRVLACPQYDCKTERHWRHDRLWLVRDGIGKAVPIETDDTQGFRIGDAIVTAAGRLVVVATVGDYPGKLVLIELKEGAEAPSQPTRARIQAEVVPSPVAPVTIDNLRAHGFDTTRSGHSVEDGGALLLDTHDTWTLSPPFDSGAQLGADSSFVEVRFSLPPELGCTDASLRLTLLTAANKPNATSLDRAAHATVSRLQTSIAESRQAASPEIAPGQPHVARLEAVHVGRPPPADPSKYGERVMRLIVDGAIAGPPRPIRQQHVGPVVGVQIRRAGSAPAGCIVRIEHIAYGALAQTH